MPGFETLILGNPTAPTFAPLGRRLGRYDLIEEVGRGGMGIVYRARHVELGKIVALKVIDVGPGTPRWVVERFEREARLIASLRHPGIVAVHDVGVEAGFRFFSMDFLRGKTLDEWLDSSPALPAMLDVLEQACRAVHHAHGEGIVHRDLKPSNVMVDESLRAVVMDFGLAKDLDGASGGGITQAGTIFGTPNFMAPEQAAGRTRDVGVPTDVYALGAMLYCAAVGRPPYVADSVTEMLIRILAEDPPRPRDWKPGLASDLEAVILQAMARDPKRRYASAADLADDLARLGRGERVLARRSPRLSRLHLDRRGAAVLLAGGGLLALTIALTHRVPDPPDPAAHGPSKSTSEKVVSPENAAPANVAPGAEDMLARVAGGTPEERRDRLMKAVVDQSPGGLELLRRVLQDLRGLPPDELRDWDARLRSALIDFPSRTPALEGLVQAIRVELRRREIARRDRALAEVESGRKRGDFHAALSRLDALALDWAGSADDALVAEIRRAIESEAERAGAGIARDFAPFAEAAKLGDHAIELDAALALLPLHVSKSVREDLESADEQARRRK